MTKELPSRREMKVLSYLGLGDVEVAARFAGVGPKTFGGMVAKGWIEEAKTEDDEPGYRITEAGDAAHERGYNAGR